MDLIIKGWFDGACWPNPGGKAGYGWAASAEGYFKQEGSGYIGTGRGMSNNVAEYTALFKLLEWLKGEGFQDEKVYVYGDSKLVVEQMIGRWRVNGGLYVRAFRDAYCMAKEFKKLSVVWIPRHLNGLADSLSKNSIGEKPDLVLHAGESVQKVVNV